MVRRAPLDGKEPVRVEDMMKNAGRAVLRGTLSLILTASLVPSQAMVAMAEELNELAAQEQPVDEVGTNETAAETEETVETVAEGEASEEQDEAAEEPVAEADAVTDEVQPADGTSVDQPAEEPAAGNEVPVLTATADEDPTEGEPTNEEPVIVAQASATITGIELDDSNLVDGTTNVYEKEVELTIAATLEETQIQALKLSAVYTDIEGKVHDGNEDANNPDPLEVRIDRNGKAKLEVEGIYTLLALVDADGNVLDSIDLTAEDAIVKQFTVDRNAVEVEGTNTLKGYADKKYVNPSERSVEIVATDIDLDTAKSSVTVNGTTVTPTISGSTYTYTVNTNADGAYTVDVNLVDRAHADEPVEKSYAFTIDRTAPVVKAVKTGSGQTGWGNKTITWHVTFTEENPDEQQSTVFDRTLSSIRSHIERGGSWKTGGFLEYKSWSFDSESNSYSFDVVVTGWNADGYVIAKGVDLAGNTGNSGEESVHVDTTAPTINNVYVTADNITVNEAAQNAGDLFFNTPGATITLELSDDVSGLVDENGNVLVQVVDLTNSYQEVQTKVNRDGSVTATIALKEDVVFNTATYEEKTESTETTDASGTASSLVTTTTYTHNGGVLVVIKDVAGNSRTWSLSEKGDISEGEAGEQRVDNEILKLSNQRDNVKPDHPSHLLLDLTKPVLELSGASKDDFYNGAVNLNLRVTEKNLNYVKTYDPQRSVLTIAQSATAGGKGAVVKTYTVSNLASDNTLAFNLSDFGDGHFEIIGSLTDIAGNTGEARIGEFTVDTVAPVISVDFDNNDVKNGKYYDAARTATVSIVEHNFDPQQTVVDINATGWSKSQPKAGSWKQDAQNHDLWTCEIPFTSDGTYTFTVSTTDKAGNKAEDLVVDEFIIDTVKPTVTVEKGGKDFDEVIKAQETKYDDISYFDTTQSITVTVTDRNLDFKTSAIMVDGKTINESDWSKNKSDDDVWTYTYTYTYDETAAKSGSNEGMSYTPKVELIDLATNADSRASQPFVVDLSAPSIDSVKVGNSTTSVGSDKDSGEDPIQFYNTDTAMTFNVSDAHRIEKVELYDPENAYTGTSSIKRGAFDGSYVIELKDGTEQSEDAEYERDIYLQITDIAGNYRTWTIGRDGKIKNVTEDSIANTVTINDSGVYPYALIKDVMAPVTALSGVTAGSYYNSAQTVHATVNEFNFGYLQRFDGSRAVLHITKYEGNAGRAMSTYEIPASSFTGSGSEWAYDEVFGSDGHYIVEASFDDYANNSSNVSRIEEFTIDMTAPVITIEFDNNDVRNGMYYNATRTATITVEEHNFDPSLINIQTTGSIGGWASSGDTHTCTVFFDEAASHNLTVSGNDLAGNAAAEVSEPEFVVDLTAPEITFGGVAQRLGFTGAEDEYNSTLQPDSAYNGVVAPSITFEDEQNFDTSGTEFTLVGNKVGDVSATYDYGQSYGTNSETVQFDDFGLKGTDTAYDVNADDIYTITAHMTDLAGNEAEGTITFSVNRFGSNYVVSVEEGGKQVDLAASSILDEAPTITVREINVSGAKSEADHSVMKEYANATSEIERQDNGNSEGYRLDTLDRRNTDHGWAEYVYTIRSANFGEGSSSDTGDGGQGIYRVNVASDDTASNVNTTADYWSSDNVRAQASAKVGTAEFTLDEVAPVIDETTLPDFIAPGSEYQASFHVTDAITQGNSVEVYVDGERVAVTREGQEVAEGDYVGEGSFEFTIPARSFATRKVAIKVTDYAGRSAEAGDSGFFVTTLIPEVGVVAAVAAAVAGGVVYSRRKKDDGESLYDDGSLLK